MMATSLLVICGYILWLAGCYAWQAFRFASKGARSLSATRAVLATVWLLFAAALLSACTAVEPTDAGCMTYGAQRPAMPRPLPEDQLGRWVAVTDAAMTGTCRG